MKLGNQYNKDESFKKEARLYQSKYRAKKLKADFNLYGNRLIDGDAYLNYYQKLNVLEDKRKRYPNYSSKRDADMLRSEHIPFNVFSPLKLNLDLAKKTFNHLLGNIISEITSIEIEYAPKPKQDYLDDGTSFDTYIEFMHKDKSKGAIGIEVKYTEQAYPIGDSERKKIDNPASKYYTVTNNSKLFIDDAVKDLIKDDFRQIWRNHILGESMKQKDDVKHFISMTLYPSGNTHFKKAIPEYKRLLMKIKQDSFIPLTFEQLFEIYTKNNNNQKFNAWIEYLKERYLISNNIDYE